MKGDRGFCLFVLTALLFFGCRTTGEIPQRTDLVEAIRRLDKEAVRKVLEGGARADDKDIDGRPALILAMRFNDAALVRLFIEHGADVNAGDRDGFTPLMVATVYRQVETFELLLEKGALVDAMSDYGLTALIIAAINDLPELTKSLLEAGADTELWLKSRRSTPFGGGAGTALSLAAGKGHVEVVRVLVEHGADINFSSIWVWGWTPLMRAVQKQRYETVRYLLEKGADTGKKVRVGRYAEAEEGTVYVIAAEINDPVMNKILGIAGSAQDIIPADYDKK